MLYSDLTEIWGLAEEKKLAFSSNCISLYPHGNEVLLIRKKCKCRFLLSKNGFKMGRIKFKLQDIGNEDNPTRKDVSWARRTNGMKEYSISMKLYRWCFCFISTLDLFYFLSFFKFHLMDWDLRIRQRHRYGQWHISCGRERGKGKGEESWVFLPIDIYEQISEEALLL